MDKFYPHKIIAIIMNKEVIIKSADSDGVLCFSDIEGDYFIV
jgi:hypothetical protein